MLRRTLASGAGIVAALSLVGCSTVDSLHSAVDTATDAAVHGMTGKRSTGGPPPAASSGGAPPPAAVNGMAMGLFQALFYQGGYHMAVADFDEGDYVRWQARGYGEGGQWFEKALLKRREDGKEWWRVVNHMGDGDTIVMEALFSPAGADGARKILRMRVQWPDKQPQEVPITKESSESWVLNRPRELTEESYAGLKQGVADVTVPAGTFTADHLSTGAPGQPGTLHWWMADNVPGGVVKFELEGEDASRVLALKSFGSGRTESRLGAF